MNLVISPTPTLAQMVFHSFFLHVLSSYRFIFLKSDISLYVLLCYLQNSLKIQHEKYCDKIADHVPAWKKKFIYDIFPISPTPNLNPLGAINQSMHAREDNEQEVLWRRCGLFTCDIFLPHLFCGRLIRVPGRGLVNGCLSPPDAISQDLAPSLRVCRRVPRDLFQREERLQ